MAGGLCGLGFLPLLKSASFFKQLRFPYMEVEFFLFSEERWISRRWFLLEAAVVRVWLVCPGLRFLPSPPSTKEETPPTSLRYFVVSSNQAVAGDSRLGWPPSIVGKRGLDFSIRLPFMEPEFFCSVPQ